MISSDTMDSVFSNESVKSNFIRGMMNNFGCYYICLWSYIHINTCLIFKDGVRRDQEPSTSSSGASRLFDQFCHQPIFLLRQQDLIPGLAFQHKIPYMEVNELDLMRMASSDVQRRFYQEARIKSVVFMGCNSGEIELGFCSTFNAQMNREMEMRSLFPDDFSRQPPPATGEAPRPADPNPHNSSSSSSFRSLSTESPEYSSLVFNISPSDLIPTRSSTMGDPIQEATIQALAQFRSPRMPTFEIEHAQMTQAILAVLTSSPPPSSSRPCHRNQNATAFRKYSGSAAPARSAAARTSMFKRSVSYFRKLNAARINQLVQSAQGQNRPSTSQLHHVMSERRRREKLNDSFQALRSLLPPGSKKDKASVLSNTREYLTSLRAQVAALSERTQALESRARLNEEAATCTDADGDSSTERVDVRIRQAATSSSSEEGVLTAELSVTVRGSESAVDLLIRLLEFIKQVNNVSLVSIEANHRLTGSTAVNRVALTLKIQGSEWDESGFKEAVKRVVGDW